MEGEKNRGDNHWFCQFYLLHFNVIHFFFLWLLFHSSIFCSTAVDTWRFVSENYQFYPYQRPNDQLFNSTDYLSGLVWSDWLNADCFPRSEIAFINLPLFLPFPFFPLIFSWSLCGTGQRWWGVIGAAVEDQEILSSDRQSCENDWCDGRSMGGMLRDALRTTCVQFGWSYAVFWRIVDSGGDSR